MKTIFALASARTGTKFLTAVFRQNIKNCVSKHEAMPTFFGRPVLWRVRDDWDPLRRLFAVKRWRIEHCGAPVYVETNHAFIKAFAELALEAFPDLGLVHVFRDPLKAAKSEMQRQQNGDRWHVPFRYYPDGKGRQIFRFGLSGEDAIYREVQIPAPTVYQWYLLQWIQIENLAMRFLDAHNKRKDCFALAHPKDINDPEAVARMFRFFDLPMRSESVVLPPPKNRSLRPTEVTEADRAALAEVVAALPPAYLRIFEQAPYGDQPWAAALRKP